MKDLYDMSILPECEAASYCIRRKVPDYSPLAMAISEFYTAGDDPMRKAVANGGSHRTLIEMADARPLVQCRDTLESSLMALAKVNYIALGDRMPIPELVREHTELLHLLVARDKKTRRTHTPHHRRKKRLGRRPETMGWL